MVTPNSEANNADSTEIRPKNVERGFEKSAGAATFVAWIGGLCGQRRTRAPLPSVFASRQSLFATVRRAHLGGSSVVAAPSVRHQAGLRFAGMRSVSGDLPSDQTRSFNSTDPI